MEIATWAGAIMTILGLVAFVLKPILSSLTYIVSNLTEIKHGLDMMNKSIEAAQSDRLGIHDELVKHDNRLDEHEGYLIRHDEQIKTLFSNRKGGE